MQFGILSYRITVCFISVILFHYMWVLVVLFSTFLKLRCYGSVSAIVVREVRYSSTCLLTRLSGSRGSWPRNKSRIGPFPNGFGWKLVIKSGTTPRGDIGDEPNWVYKESHIRDVSHVYALFMLSASWSHWKKTTIVGTVGHFIGNWIIFLLIFFLQ